MRIRALPRHSKRLRQSLKSVAEAERFSLKQTRKASVQLFNLAAKTLKTGLPDTFDTSFINAFQRPLAEGLLIANLKARLLIRSMAPKVETIQFSQLTDTVRAYRRLNPTRLVALQRRSVVDAFKILEGISQPAEQAVRDTIAQTIAQGLPTKTAKQELMKTFQRLGISARNHFHLETLVRTHTQLAHSAGMWGELQEPEIDEILWGFEYSTVGDNRVRDDHDVLDGTTLPKEHSFWDTFFPPNGFNCRCQAIPIFEEEQRRFPSREPIADSTFNFNPGKVLSGII